MFTGRDQVKTVSTNDRLPDTSVDPAQAAVSKKSQMSLDKSFKDLHRQTVSLERLKIVLSENVDKSFKRVSEVFKELHNEWVAYMAWFQIFLSSIERSSHNTMIVFSAVVSSNDLLVDSLVYIIFLCLNTLAFILQLWKYRMILLIVDRWLNILCTMKVRLIHHIFIYSLCPFIHNNLTYDALCD